MSTPTPKTSPAHLVALELVPHVHASDFPREVDDEFTDKDIYTHSNSCTFRINWGDDAWPATKAWLTATYGEGIKLHRLFAMTA